MDEPDNRAVEELSERIKELGSKSTQMLTFLSFALVVVVTLWSNPSITNPGQKQRLVAAIHWWLLATVPVLLAIVPVKEIKMQSRDWYRFVKWAKIILLWSATVLIFLGLCDISRAI
jgi:hypothetical protein